MEMKIGNAKRWKNDSLTLYNPDSDEIVAAMGLKADLVERNGETGIVEFSWRDGNPFSRVLSFAEPFPFLLI